MLGYWPFAPPNVSSLNWTNLPLFHYAKLSFDVYDNELSIVWWPGQDFPLNCKMHSANQVGNTPFDNFFGILYGMFFTQW